MLDKLVGKSSKDSEMSVLPRVHIAVLGAEKVGKSALAVRYLTRRYIGEYSSITDHLYSQTISLDSGLLELVIVDVSPDAESENGFPMSRVHWADACLIVYSITERESFKYASRSLANWKSLQNAPTAYLIANKSDLDHLREVAETEGAALAAAHGIGFCEVSVADNTPSLYKAFERLISPRGRPTKQRKFSMSKVIGSLMGNNDTSKPIPLYRGTMMPCGKGQLHLLRLQKRRQGYIATASL